VDGQHHDQWTAFTTGDDPVSVTGEFRLGPTSTLGQISLGDLFEFDDESHADVGFTSATFIDGNGVSRTDHFPDVDAFGATHVFARNNLTAATWELRVSNVAISTILNFFFWSHVS
jgi:hypothetical protein